MYFKRCPNISTLAYSVAEQLAPAIYDSGGPQCHFAAHHWLRTEKATWMSG